MGRQGGLQSWSTLSLPARLSSAGLGAGDPLLLLGLGESLLGTRPSGMAALSRPVVAGGGRCRAPPTYPVRGQEDPLALGWLGDTERALLWFFSLGSQ